MTEDSGTERHPRFDDDLIGLDPDDPEARAFAEHLDRMQRCDPAFTVEGSLRGVAEFADTKNIVVMRTENGVQKAIKFNYRDVVQGKNLQQNVLLKPGDTVLVKR